MPGKEVITFGDTEVDKRKFYRYKNRIFLNGVNVDKILVSKKISFGKKVINSSFVTQTKVKLTIITIILYNTINYNSSKKLMHTDNVTTMKQNRCIFFIEDKESLKSIIIFGNDITNNRKQRFDSEPVQNKRHLKTKPKSYGNKTTCFYVKEMPKAGFHYNFSGVISLDFVLQKNKNHYLQMFLN